jgi:hypothetical protein
MSETHRIEIEFDDRCYQALLAEADRLSVSVDKLVSRAVAAWVTEIAENTSACTATVTLVS